MEFKIIPLTFLASSLVFGQAISSPILSDSLISIDFIGSEYSGTTSENAYYSNSTDGASGYGDLVNGKVGSKSIEVKTNVVVKIFDTLTFDSTATVSFEYTIDGMLSSDSIFNNPYGQGRIDIYDITGLDSWLETDSFLGLFDQVEVSENANVLSNNNISIDLDKIRGLSTQEGEILIERELSRDGTLHNVDYTLSGSFEVDPSKTYGIKLSANTYVSEGVADFSNTGTFAFTDLGGATFTSGSGAFLSQQQTTVPEPSSVLMFGFALSGFTLSRKKNKFK
ncbi:PEP-CTERM sorting domain-containing protein [Colwellia sp. UCD-KL20]|uniref:PEP-CTERM sorting domain-containing protein n=1 Tax=Colwellia sp. UCD-KL20 TaxID=1917165 RepID=UPI00097029F8|nr:PEP-CTERM sorting domain-containing protein [Colwellia sp. UCD-KL20]